MRGPAVLRAGARRRRDVMRTTALSALLLVAGCTREQGSERNPAEAKKAVVRDGGQTIIFPSGSPGLDQISVSGVKKGKATLSMAAPARIVATVSPLAGRKERTILFETPDITSLYSAYLQSRSNAERTSRNLARIREMFDHQAATGKDLNEAENDAAVARASTGEMEGRLRALGFTPSELETAVPNSAWVIADVPENALSRIRRGEPVSLTLSAFPQMALHGQADAIGDVVDPVTRTVKVRVSIRNNDGRFLPGMFARVTFGQEEQSAIILPLSSVVTVEGKDHVFVEAAPGEFHRREVTLVNSSGSEAVVLHGLEDNERIVTGGTMLLKGISFGY